MNKTPLNQWHHEHNGRMVDFAGWEMPVQYSSIVEEHNAVRSAAGLFDISHMGRLQFFGETEAEFLNSVVTNDTRRLKPGDVRYSLVCNYEAGILDDVLVYRMEDRWELVVNASNRLKICEWLEHCAGFAGIKFVDRTLSTGMIAVQGPKAVGLVSELLGIDVSTLKYYSAKDAAWQNQPVLVSRTGYTGEDGFELVVANELAQAMWNRLLELGGSKGLVAAGLGCRDTLRLEAAMPLYGHELNEHIDPLTAGLDFAVRFNKPEYPGKAAMEQIRDAGLKTRRVGLKLEGRRIAREESPVLHDGAEVGKVTSGTFSPTLQQVIAMAYVPLSLANDGQKLQVSLRGTPVNAEVVPLPFYKRSK